MTGKPLLKAYVVDDETGEAALFDEFAVKKTTEGSVNETWVDLPEISDSIFPIDFFALAKQIIWVLRYYLLDLLPQVIGNAA